MLGECIQGVKFCSARLEIMCHGSAMPHSLSVLQRTDEHTFIRAQQVAGTGGASPRGLAATSVSGLVRRLELTHIRGSFMSSSACPFCAPVRSILVG
jgi:hypothetical protein